MNTSLQTPWSNPDGLPAFSEIRSEHIPGAMERLLEEARATVADVLAKHNSGIIDPSRSCGGETNTLGSGASIGPTPCRSEREAPTSSLGEIEDGAGTIRWDALILPLEELDDFLNRVWSPVSHLHSVADNPKLREAHNACLPMLSEYSTELGQNEQLFHAFQQISVGEEMARLSPARRKILENSLLDFRLSGVGLDAKDKARFKAISARLATLKSKFSENVLDATNAWEKHILERETLSGLPESALALARQTAERKGRDGWLLTLEFPSYLSVITFADDPALRREIYEAYATRSSDQGPNAGQWDNTEVMEEILALRGEKARLLGFPDYSEYSLVRKMAPSPDHVLDFLRDLARRARPMAERELEEVRAFARDRMGSPRIEAWDIPYYSEKLYQDRFSFSQEELRVYFPLPKVLSGLFEVARRLFGIRIQPVEGRETWHPDARFYRVRDSDGATIGGFYLDPYARPHKRGGAWMDECITRKALGGPVQSPIAYLICNFGPPIGDNPSLLTHEEVLTLFHEFGHALHHLLTRIDYPSIAGINGVPWDAVELPSQLLELWCWEPETLRRVSGHVETGAPLPDTLLDSLRESRNFHSGMAMVRQLEYALFDFRLHRDYHPSQSEPKGAQIQRLLGETRDEVAVVTSPAFHRPAHSFSHIFAGGYAAGYYSYKWAEMLASDAFSKFEENGIFDRDTGALFQQTILEQGGARDAMDLFKEFRGRGPVIDALLRHSGIDVG
uniref:oligopeptidase A n=1 Tax=Candidatus Kentrum sp. SD TaxID=2126332 RepID=A0A450YK13_9GAMM|nr:MAG: oligopeptidase A [Candidatus Kentron sp. SD]VFK47755.1 MAG: oligopeptidase A [Candidatus Kentron sp. SD]